MPLRPTASPPLTRIRIHAQGDWRPGQVTSTPVPDGRRRLPAVDAAIDAAWAAAARPSVRLFDGPMCRLERWHATPDRLRLDLSPTSYKPFVGTNMANPQLAEQFGRDVMANPVGVSTTLVTADGWLLLGRRNDRVAYYPNRVHCFAGCLEPTDADVFTAVRRELAEELSLAPGEVTDLRCTGVAEDVSLRQPELTFAATTSLTRLQVAGRLDPAEHASLWSTPADPVALVTALSAEVAQFTPIATAAALLDGRLRFGTAWFANGLKAVHTIPRVI